MTIEHLGIVKCERKLEWDLKEKWEEGRYVVYNGNKLIKIFSYQAGYALMDGYRNKEEALVAAKEFIK